MNWYVNKKLAALEQKWWIRFFHHLSGAAKYVFPDEGASRDPSDFRILLQPNSFETINDGPQICFAFYVWRKGHSYRCSLNLLFSQSLNGSTMKWEPGSKIVGLQEQEGNDFVRANWSVIRDFYNRNDSELVTNGILTPSQATPLTLMETLKNAVLHDGDNDDNDDNDDSDGLPDKPTPPTKKKPLPVKPQVKPALMPQIISATTQDTKLVKLSKSHTYSCVMATIDAKALKPLVDCIQSEDIVDEENETGDHTTVLYGLHTPCPEEVRPILEATAPFDVKLDKISCFPADAKRDSDCLIIEVSSPVLNSLNKKLREMPHTNSYSEYKPHITLAYVKKGLGDKYVDYLSNAKNSTFERLHKTPQTVTEFIFSSKDGDKTTIQAKGKKKQAGRNWYSRLKLAMPLDPNAHKLYGPGETHRLPSHSGFDQIFDHRTGRVQNVPTRQKVTPQQQQLQNELYSGTHASMSPEIAAIYANNNSTPQDPPVVIGFTSVEPWRTDADTTGPEAPDVLRILIDEYPHAREIAMQPFDQEAVTELMQELKQHDNMFDESGSDSPDLLEDIHRAHRSDTIDQVPQFYEHYYGNKSARMFYKEFLVPLFSGKGYDPRVQAYMTNQMRFMKPIPHTQIVSIGTTERFSTDYTDDDQIDLDDWDEEEGELPELDEDNRRMYSEDGRRNVYYHGEPFDPRIHWVWHNPQITKNVKTFYHGTTKSRALRALPELAQYINQIGVA